VALDPAEARLRGLGRAGREGTAAGGCAECGKYAVHATPPRLELESASAAQELRVQADQLRQLELD